MKFIKFSKLSFILLTAFLSLSVGCEQIDNPRRLADTHCSSCHMVPNPQDLPSEVWEKSIFPEMSNYFKWSSMSQYAYANKAFYNKKAAIPMTDGEWSTLLAYYMDSSQEEMPLRESITAEEQAFFKPVLLDQLCDMPSITALSIGERGQLYAASQQMLSTYKMSESTVKQTQYNGIATQIIEIGMDSLYILNAGKLGPHDIALGSLELLNLQSGSTEPIISGLKRPVYSLLEDAQIYISQFGNASGLISKSPLQKSSTNKTDTLMSLPGCYKMQKVDLDLNGQSEIITICAQALEGVYSLSMDKKGGQNKLIAFPPQFGLSDFVMCDINGDDALDIIITNGDNADYSNVPKEYHGLRIYLNDKKGHFDLSYFYPIYGATQVQFLALDEDQRPDLIVSSYFAIDPEESILIFKNQTITSNQLDFEVYTLPEASKGRWLVMTKGDIDHDGDDDIVIGSNINGPTAIQNPKWPAMWQEESVDAILLLNQLSR